MESSRAELQVDQSQVKKAVLALQAFIKSSSSSRKLFQSDGQPISLLFTMWKIPHKEQTIRVPLPHGLRTNSGDVCLFTKDEPNMNTDQTIRFYKKFLSERGVKHPIEVIPFHVLKTEYKTFEAKRRLLGNFDLFLSDARIHHRLPTQIGKHFYQRKKNPLSLDLESKHLAKNMENLIQGTSLTVSKKGSCCMARVSHSGHTADEIIENVMTTISTVSAKLKSTTVNVKIIHLKSQNSASLPIYTSDLSHLAMVEAAQKKTGLIQGKRKKKANTEAPESVMEEEKDAEEEEIPQLVPIETPIKKRKQEKGSSKKAMKKAPRPMARKGVKKSIKVKKLGKKTPKSQKAA